MKGKLDYLPTDSSMKARQKERNITYVMVGWLAMLVTFAQGKIFTVPSFFFACVMRRNIHQDRLNTAKTERQTCESRWSH